MIHFPKSLRFRVSWCGCPLHSGVKVIGFFSLICNLIGGLWRVVQWYFFGPDFDDAHATSLDRLHMFVLVATAILSFILVICSGVLLGGAYNNKRWLLVPWLVCDSLIRCVLICSFAHSLAMAVNYQRLLDYVHGRSRDKPMPSDEILRILPKFLPKDLTPDLKELGFSPFYRNLEIFLAVCCAIGILFGLYIWWLVLSFFLELKEKEEVQTRPLKAGHVELQLSAV